MYGLQRQTVVTAQLKSKALLRRWTNAKATFYVCWASIDGGGGGVKETSEVGLDIFKRHLMMPNKTRKKMF